MPGQVYCAPCASQSLNSQGPSRTGSYMGPNGPSVELGHAEVVDRTFCPAHPTFRDLPRQLSSFVVSVVLSSLLVFALPLSPSATFRPGRTHFFYLPSGQSSCPKEGMNLKAKKVETEGTAGSASGGWYHYENDTIPAARGTDRRP